MPVRPARRFLAHGWLYVPAASSPIGGGLIKLGQGSTWAVGLAPYAVCALLFSVFVIGYLATLTRCLCAKPEQQEVREHLITVSANAFVSVMTLTACSTPGAAKPTSRS